MADKNPFNDIEEMERSGFSDYSILICTALSEFLWRYDIVQRIWLEQSGSFEEPLERLSLARSKVKKFFWFRNGCSTGTNRDSVWRWLV